MRPKALNELLAELSRRAGLAQAIHPHQLRHFLSVRVAMAVIGGQADLRPAESTTSSSLPLFAEPRETG